MWDSSCALVMLFPRPLLSLCMAGLLCTSLAVGGFPSFLGSAEKSFLQIGGQTFIRYEETLNWSSALLFCRRRYMDLANLQMVPDGDLLRPIMSGTEAWIGLYYDTSTRSKTWSSNLGTSIPPWLIVPILEQSKCVGLRSAYYLAASALNCSCLQPFICFSDLNSVLAKTTSTPSTGINIGSMSVSSGLASTTGLSRPGIPEPPEACLGTRALCASASAAPQPQGVTSTSPSADPSPPQSTLWMTGGEPRIPPATAHGASLGLTSPGGTPIHGEGSGSTAKGGLVSLLPSVETSGTQQVTAHGMSLEFASSQNVTPPTTSQGRYPLDLTTPVPGKGPTTLPAASQSGSVDLTPSLGSLVPTAGPRTLQATVQGRPVYLLPLLPPSVPPGSLSAPKEGTETPVALALSSASLREPVPSGRSGTRWGGAASSFLDSTSLASATPRTAAAGVSSAPGWPHSSETLGSSPWTEESPSGFPGSGNPAVAQRTTAWLESAAQGQAAAQETTATAVRSTEGGTRVPHLTASTSYYPDTKQTAAAPASGHTFGILRADFVVSSLTNPEEIKDQFLSEIQEVLKQILGHEQFSLKWVGFEVNKR